MSMSQCRYFNGYKPCGKNTVCNENCDSLSIPTTRLLIIHLEALGAVLRSTALLAPIKRKFPNSHITWVTLKPADQLLQNNPLIDRVLAYDIGLNLALTAMKFDATFCIDKSLQATGLAAHIDSDLFFGFELDRYSGSILPATKDATELWEIGLSDQKKFFENQKAETQLTCEALNLGPFQRDHYILRLTQAEQIESRKRKTSWSKNSKPILGFNTGCSNVISYKKLSVAGHRELIQKLSGEFQIVLLGGREDTSRNFEIGEGLDVIQSPTDLGLRDGIISCDACDIIVSGDSLGMHIGIALKKWMVTWFGPTCSQEIDLFDFGVKVLSEAPCGPCWKRVCEKTTMCYDLVDLEKICAAVRLGQQRILKSHEDFNYSDSIHR